MTALGQVFRPLTIGPVTLRNRVFVSAHTTNLGERHVVSDRLVAYHRARAAGGVGLTSPRGCASIRRACSVPRPSRSGPTTSLHRCAG